MDCSTIRCIAGFLARFPESTDSGKYRLLRQDFSMDAASPSDTTGGSFRFHFTLYRTGLLMSLQSGGYEWYTAIKWWILSAAQVAAMIIPVPGKLLNRKLGKAILQIPTLALAMIANMFRLKGARNQKVYSYRARRRIKPHRERKEKAQMTRINTDLAAQPLKSVLASVSSVPKISL